MSEQNSVAAVQSSLIELRELLQRHVRELERSYPERHTREWFFLRYVKRVHKRAHDDDTPRACLSAMRGLTRYYVDSIDEDSELGKRFEEILECHRYALRTERRG